MYEFFPLSLDVAHSYCFFVFIVSCIRSQGGGTLDISILHVSEGYCDVMGSDGDDRLGGADFDTAVAHLLTQQHAAVLENLSYYNGNGKDEDNDMAEILASSCDRVTDDLPLCSVSSFHTLGEKVKISLSEQQQQQYDEHGKLEKESIVARTECLALPPFTAENKSSTIQSLCESLTVEALEVTLEDYNAVCKPLFDRSVIPATRLIEDLTLQIEEIDEIVMVGGTTRMPQIRELVRAAFPNAQLNTHIDPDVTVVRITRHTRLFLIASWIWFVWAFCSMAVMILREAWVSKGLEVRNCCCIHPPAFSMLPLRFINDYAV